MKRTAKWAAMVSLLGTATVCQWFGGGCVSEIVSWVAAPLRWVVGGWWN